MDRQAVGNSRWCLQVKIRTLTLFWRSNYCRLLTFSIFIDFRDDSIIFFHNNLKLRCEVNVLATCMNMGRGPVPHNCGDRVPCRLFPPAEQQWCSRPHQLTLIVSLEYKPRVYIIKSFRHTFLYTATYLCNR